MNYTWIFMRMIEWNMRNWRRLRNLFIIWRCFSELMRKGRSLDWMTYFRFYLETYTWRMTSLRELLLLMIDFVLVWSCLISILNRMIDRSLNHIIFWILSFIYNVILFLYFSSLIIIIFIQQRKPSLINPHIFHRIINI